MRFYIFKPRGRMDKDIMRGAKKKKINAHCNAITLLSCYFVLIRFVRVWTALFIWLDKFAFLADSLSTPANDVFRHARL